MASALRMAAQGTGAVGGAMQLSHQHILTWCRNCIIPQRLDALDDLLPDLVTLAELLHNTAAAIEEATTSADNNADEAEETIAAANFVCKQLLRIAMVADYADEAGRRAFIARIGASKLGCWHHVIITSHAPRSSSSQWRC